MPDDILSHTPLENPLVFFIIIFSLGFILFKIVKFLLTRKRNKQTAINHKKQATTPQTEAAKKEIAIEKFKKVHSRAHDHRKKLKEEISAHPKESAQALRRMMKRH